jgi:hypothetical protein
MPLLKKQSIAHAAQEGAEHDERPIPIGQEDDREDRQKEDTPRLGHLAVERPLLKGEEKLEDGRDNEKRQEGISGDGINSFVHALRIRFADGCPYFKTRGGPPSKKAEIQLLSLGI